MISLETGFVYYVALVGCRGVDWRGPQNDAEKRLELRIPASGKASARPWQSKKVPQRFLPRASLSATNLLFFHTFNPHTKKQTTTTTTMPPKRASQISPHASTVPPIPKSPPSSTAPSKPATTTSSSFSSFLFSSKTSSSSSPNQTAQEVLSNLGRHYLNATPQRVKLVDAFMAFLVVVGGLQFVYCVLVGNYVGFFFFFFFFLPSFFFFSFLLLWFGSIVRGVGG